MPPTRRRPRWNIGDLYAIHLTPRHDAIAQLLEDNHVAILDGAVPVGSPAPSADELMKGWIYRVLFVVNEFLVEATRIGRLPFLIADVPPVFTGDTARGYKIHEADGSSRSATRVECRGLEPMCAWSHWNLINRLRDQFLRGGYVPSDRHRP
ncbi:MAG: hypothetical protein IPL61_27405 [Myxococcales bacterium]|nr:hypothetical protein [Myxococcales bacterium]